MAAGDVYNKIDADVDSSETFLMQPDSGVEVVIHNITHTDTATLQFTDGSTVIDVDTQTGAGAWMGMFLHCTNGAYYRLAVANNNTKICCDGMVTK